MKTNTLVNTSVIVHWRVRKNKGVLADVICAWELEHSGNLRNVLIRTLGMVAKLWFRQQNVVLGKFHLYFDHCTSICLSLSVNCNFCKISISDWHLKHSFYQHPMDRETFIRNSHQNIHGSTSDNVRHAWKFVSTLRPTKTPICSYTNQSINC